MFLGILHILFEASDDDHIALFVSGEADVNLKPFHHLADSLATGTNQSAVDTMVYLHLFRDLFLLGGGKGGREGGREGEGMSLCSLNSQLPSMCRNHTPCVHARVCVCVYACVYVRANMCMCRHSAMLAT